MTDFLGIAVVGVIVSLVIETISRYAGTDSLKTKWLTILVTVVFGAAYTFLRSTTWWETILGILAAASTVYAFIFKK